MPEDQTELEHTPTVREVKLNEWFRPFANYDDIPYRHKDPKRSHKEITYRIAGVGELDLTLAWEQLEYESKEFGIEGTRVLVVLPTEEKVIKPQEVVEYQRKLESSLMELIVGTHEETLEKPIDILVTVRLPSGREFKSQITQEDYVTTSWKSENGEECADIFLPDVGNIMKQVEVKFEE